MGETYVEVTVKNPAAPQKAWKGVFLADTGTSTSVVPRRRLEEIGIEPISSRFVELADGSTVSFDLGAAVLSFGGQDNPAAVFFGADDVEPLLGTTAMQTAGVKVDPVNHRLEPAKIRC
ncbi:MAG: aspartyl protease family protein [Acidimicrobiaceae bacterium]|nr:aspartyl protease family protein [Acidimicrobiaceae bacterium]MCY4174988.1 aspartyl protease family protein [Acidimicrobiaceae bacterium]MCY4280061.1 aspartyl protease family protein [Acidimicrobiaceae bacterium]MCY4293665.1 aspartyl protease family protein [Acidimicrobiaceae bacterium]